MIVNEKNHYIFLIKKNCFNAFENSLFDGGLFFNFYFNIIVT
jgi:hypothetical protein